MVSTRFDCSNDETGYALGVRGHEPSPQAAGRARGLSTAAVAGVIAASRDLLVVLATFFAGLVTAALGQAAFSHWFPVFSSRIVGSTDIATYALLVLIAAMFSMIGSMVPRWIKGSRPLLWLLLPIASVYVAAILGQPDVYRCNPVSTGYAVGCWTTLSPFIAGLLAVVGGYLVRGRKVGSERRSA